jgi:hypothetical protein
MIHRIHRVTRFEIVGPYTLALGFEDGTDQVIDFEPVLRGELFGALRDRTVFDAVVLDSEAGTWSGRTALTSTRPRSTTGPE